MGITYYLIPLIFRRKIIGMGWARWQPWLFFIGLALLSISMIVLGQLGVPRRHWDSSFSGGTFTYNFNPAIGLLLDFDDVRWQYSLYLCHHLDSNSGVIGVFRCVSPSKRYAIDNISTCTAC
jgi:heme/copper-type cytochrome/quinol oxidase subunit 1